MTEITDEVSFINEQIKYTYKVVPPEGGWGNVITLALAVMFVSNKHLRIYVHVNTIYKLLFN